MSVQVEFFGIPRARAGVPLVRSEGDSLGDVLGDLARRFPQLAETCIDGRNLREGYTANLGGTTLVSDPETPLRDGDKLLLLSIDAGG